MLSSCRNRPSLARRPNSSVKARSIDPGSVGDARELNQIAEGILESLRRATPVDPAKPVRYPGEQTLQLREENMRLGVPVDPEIWGQISGSS